MNVCICSAFRNAAQHVGRYFRQVAGLYLALAARGGTLTLLLGEGDSSDSTRTLLHDAMRQTGLAGKILDVAHGGPAFGSIVNTRRFAQLAAVYNTLWTHIPDGADVVVFVEGDLIWQPRTLLGLANRLQGEVQAVAPMIFHAPGCMLYGDPQGKWFYDRWGFAAQGTQFGNVPPFHPCVNGHPVALDSAGSCIVMTAAAARAVHFPAKDMVVGMTRLLAAQGMPVWLQPDLEIEHPNE